MARNGDRGHGNALILSRKLKFLDTEIQNLYKRKPLAETVCVAYRFRLPAGCSHFPIARGVVTLFETG
jgi:hypothetical protein